MVFGANTVAFGANTRVFRANTVVIGRWSVVIGQRLPVTVIGQCQLLMTNDYRLIVSSKSVF